MNIPLSKAPISWYKVLWVPSGHAQGHRPRTQEPANRILRDAVEWQTAFKRCDIVLGWNSRAAVRATAGKLTSSNQSCLWSFPYASEVSQIHHSRNYARRQ